VLKPLKDMQTPEESSTLLSSVRNPSKQYYTVRKMDHVAQEVNVREKMRRSVDMAQLSSESGRDPYCRCPAEMGRLSECFDGGARFHGEADPESSLGGRHRNRGYLLL
jgi:hypothetical protein